MRLIDADALKENIGECPENWTDTPEEVQRQNDWFRVMDEIDSAPTLYMPQDTLLRCRTCSFFISQDYIIGVTGGCSMFGGARTADDYCSKGAWISNATD